MSIGEAENYRWYWQNEWDADNDGQPDSGAPSCYIQGTAGSSAT